jgi:hypothetical protein
MRFPYVSSLAILLVRWSDSARIPMACRESNVPNEEWLYSACRRIGETIEGRGEGFVKFSKMCKQECEERWWPNSSEFNSKWPPIQKLLKCIQNRSRVNAQTVALARESIVCDDEIETPSQGEESTY